MFTNFHGNTANDVWKSIYESLRVSSVVGSRAGDTREILHAAISIDDPVQKWISFRNPPISIAYALAELIYILNGSDDASVINYWNEALPRYAGTYKNYPGAYGNRLINHYKINQIEKVYETLKAHPDSRQAVMIIWDPREDLPIDNGEPRNKDIPCNICSMIKVRDEKLEWTQIMRSNDIFLGLPYNIIQFTSIQEIIASWLGIKVGSYNHISDSLHLYTKNESILRADGDEVINTDKLGIPKEHYPEVINKIYSIMETISHNHCITGTVLSEMAGYDTKFEAYNNILRVICAYAANKIHDISESEMIMEKCTNTAYTGMWKSWVKIKGGK